MNPLPLVVVFGAYGHTGRFVIAELCKRGWRPILSGRHAEQLADLGRAYPDLERRVAAIDDPASLDRAFDSAFAILNCAGPFLDTAEPVLQAALRAHAHYLDLSAEQQAVLNLFRRFHDQAVQADVTVVPAMAFYGGLADLLASAALAEWPDADRIEIGVALNHWHPTEGTRRTGARNQHPRVVWTNGALQAMSDPAATRHWDFAAPFGEQSMIAVPLSEIITISRHLPCAEVRSYMNLAPLNDLRNPDSPAPAPAHPDGRSAQSFIVDVLVHREHQTRRASAQGIDIYATSAPLIVEALQRLADKRCSVRGVIAPGAAFDARSFLASLPDVAVRFSD